VKDNVRESRVKLQNMKVRTKISLLAIVALAGVAGFGLTAQSQLKDVAINGPLYDDVIQNKDIIADILPPPLYIIESYLKAYELADSTAETSTLTEAGVQALVDEYRALAKVYHERHEHWIDNLKPGAIKSGLTEGSAEPALEFFHVMDNEFLPAVARKDHETARSLLTNELTSLYRAHRSQIDKVVVNATTDAARIEESCATALTATNRGFLLVGTTVAGIIGLMSWFMIRSISQPLTRLVGTLKDVASGEGDLTARLHLVRKDEIGEVGKWFDTFVERIQQTVSDVAQATNQVAAAATEIAASSEQMATGMASQTQQAQLVAAAVEEMSASITDVANKSREASDAAKESGKRASGGGEAVQETITQIKGIAHQVAEGVAAVGQLGARSEQIGQIIRVINDIADQTNLLALNAAIEAARAGEHGRGFAVVADEVRKLAERTTSATEEVASNIGAIQQDTKKAVSLIEACTSRVETGVTLSETAGEKLEENLASSNTLVSMVQSITAACTEQATASDEIARNIERITAVTNESSEGTRQVAQSASQLSREADRLRSLVGRFKIAA